MNSIVVHKNKNAYPPVNINEPSVQSIFNKRISKIIDENLGPNFNWDGVYWAGGLLSMAIDPYTDVDSDKYKLSDIDLYVPPLVNYPVYRRHPVIRRLLSYFENLYNNNFHVLRYKDTSIYTLVIPNKRQIQIIPMMRNTNKSNFTSDFDLAHCQISFDGNSVHFTDQCANAFKTRIDMICGHKQISAYRLVKAWLLGFSLGRNLKYNQSIKNTHGYTMTESNETAAMVDELSQYVVNQLSITKGLPTNWEYPYNTPAVYFDNVYTGDSDSVINNICWTCCDKTKCRCWNFDKLDINRLLTNTDIKRLLFKGKLNIQLYDPNQVNDIMAEFDVFNRSLLIDCRSQPEEDIKWDLNSRSKW